MAINGDWKGVGDARPGSSAEAEKGQGGGSPKGGDWKGEKDNRPKSSCESQKVSLGNPPSEGVK